MPDLVRLTDQASDYYQGVLEYQVLLQAEQPQLDRLQDDIDRQQANQFAQSADEQGISLWEDVTGIRPDPGISLTARRMAVIQRLLPPQPVTLPYLQHLLDLLQIDARISLSQTTPFHLDITFSSSDDQAAVRLDRLLCQLAPANLTFTMLDTLTETVPGSTHEAVATLSSTRRVNKQ